MKTVKIVCPVRDRAWILPHYLDHIYCLDYPKKNVGLHWLINQSTDESENLLRDFKKKHQHEYKEIIIENYFGSKKVPKDARTTNIRNEFIYSHLSEMRNHLLDSVGDYDYIFSCDCDILVRPDTLRKLVFSNQKIIAGTIFNGYLKNSSEPWRFPNILKKLSDGSIEHISNSYIKNAPILTESKVSRVFASGAIILIDKEICAQTRYSWHKQGEDLGHAEDCEKQGYKTFVDYSAFNYHIMSKEYLDLYLKDKTLLH